MFGNQKKSPVRYTDGRGFFASLARDLMLLVFAFAIGTGVGALVCWYYDLPLLVSLLGGFIVLVITLFFLSDSLWF